MGGKEENKGNILFTGASPILHGGQYHKPAIKMAIPVWQVSVDGHIL
jgi:hypothetical protein